MSPTQRIFRYHFQRLWPQRHNRMVRAAIKDNLRGQRWLRNHP